MIRKLLYVGDVPVEASYHGSALLHRLLSDYPPDSLTVLETGTQSELSRRLQRVKYISYPIGKQRLLDTRLHPYFTAWYSQTGSRIGPRILQSLNGFAFESVLTVVHGFGWLAAASIARERQVPLHLIAHDDWPRVADVAPVFRKWLDERFAGVYRQASSCLCVSPAMSRVYEKRYGKRAAVVYPSRASDCVEFEEPPERLADTDRQFTIAFAGTVNSNGYFQSLIALQAALKSIGGRLLIFGPLTTDDAHQAGLNEPGTQICGLLSSSDLLRRLRDEADALFVPMSFEETDRANMEMAFPSKLADYTALGLPLLVYGPTYCSAVAWARENAGVAEVVESRDGLTSAIDRLANQPAHRVALGKHSLDAGRKYFTHEAARESFYQALSVESA